MKSSWVFLFATLVLGACASSDTGPVFNVQDPLYDWVKSPDAIDARSDHPPDLIDQTVVFKLMEGDKRSILRTGDDWRIGQTYLFGFDVRVDPKTLGREEFTVSRLTRTVSPQSEIAVVELNAQNGVTVFGRSCVPANALQSWHRVEMRIKLSNGDTGYLEVFCDRQPVWAQSAFRTTLPPVCRLRDGCATLVAKPARFDWQVGLMARQHAKRPVTLEMRKLHQRVIFYVPNRVGTL